MTTKLTPQGFSAWSQYIHGICSIELDSSKSYLIETRLKGLLQQTAATSYEDLLHRVRGDVTRKLEQQVIDAITTNETSFFRDSAPFELLRHKLLPELVDRRRQSGMRRVPIRIWSAACSTGQEVYSTAIVLKELLGNVGDYDIRILATDISDQAIGQASRGLFSPHEISRGLDPSLINRHFVAEGDKWKIRDELRAMATFRTLNLFQPFSFPTPFDIIFCRNVAIYFNESDRIQLFRNLGRFLARDGALIIGSTESITGLCPEFKPQRYHRSVFYLQEK
ncbi:MAG: protein-glutamate O-methyltransferase CheR [Desulfuromonadaceae bacterium]|nr:protein-glutamate O-methyltransferase CheR [Desulfuromonadaceae bacterium]